MKTIEQTAKLKGPGRHSTSPASDLSLAESLHSSYPFWEGLPPEDKDALLQSSSIQSYARGSFVYSVDGDCIGIFRVLKGQMRVYIQSEEGREITLFLLSAGELCTLSASCLIKEITFDIQIQAESDSRILITSACCFHTVMDRNILVENYIYKHTARHFSEVMWVLTQILFLSFDKRLATYLLSEADRTGTDTIRTTHEQIARNLSSAREVVSRMLKDFEKEGIVTLSRGSITIADKVKLTSHADADS